MSVPPPSAVPNSTSTGSSRWSVRSTTSVSKTTSEVRTDRMVAITAPKIDAYTMDLAIDPDWSIARMMSLLTTWARRPCPTRRSGTMVFCSGR